MKCKSLDTNKANNQKLINIEKIFVELVGVIIFLC